MTLEQFNSADNKDRALTLGNGVCVAGRDEGEYKVLLYQLQQFYVEIFYHPRKKIIARYRGFEETDLLDKYLDKINLAFI